MNQTEGSKLYEAARTGDVKVIRQLLPQIEVQQAADKDWLDRSLAQAVRGKSVEAADLLLTAGANPNQTTSIGTLLSGAAMNGDLPLVKRLIEAGADFNREIKRETPLSAALSGRQAAVIEYLEKLGAHSPPNTTLFYACEHGDIARAKKALAEGAEIEKPGGMFDETPLMAAARKGQLESVKFLLENGANPNQRVKDSCALFDAVAAKNPEVFERLIAAGADIHAKRYDETLLMAAAKGGCLALVKRLLELGADVNARDKNHNQTALDQAKLAKHKDVIEYLTGLGAKSERDAGRALMKVLAKEYGGKPVEHSHGFRLDSKFAGNSCQFHAYPDRAAVVVHKLNYKEAELKHAEAPGLIFGGELPSPDQLKQAAKKVEVKDASALLGIQVRRAGGEKAVPDEFVRDFCRRHRDFFKQLNLSSGEQLGITSETARFFWTATDVAKILPRLKLFENFVREISRPAEPERRLFESEWRLEPAPKTAGTASKVVHTLGGRLKKPVTCPHCGRATHLMAQIDLSDPALPKTPLGSGKLPVFWCLDCLEWDAAIFDISGPVPKALAANGKAAKAGAHQAGEEDLPERRVSLVPVPRGRKAERKSKIGGSPGWIQAESTPNCPKCERPMAFVLQLASDRHISYDDLGMLYCFACPDCKISASLVQSH